MAEETGPEDKMDPTNHASDGTNHTDISDADPAPKTETRGEEASPAKNTSKKGDGCDHKMDKAESADRNDRLDRTKCEASGGSSSENASETKGRGDGDGPGDARRCKDEMKNEGKKEKEGQEEEEGKGQTETAAENKRTENERVDTSSTVESDAADVGASGDRTRNLSGDSTSSGNSDSESDTDKDDEEDGRRLEDSDHDISSDLENEIMARKLPLPKSQALHDIRARELGEFQRNIKPFCCKFMGSVPMVQRLEKYCELKHHEGCVNTLHFNPTGTLLASGSDDLEIVLWDWAHQKSRLIFESGHRSNVFQAKFMPCSGDATLVSCARDGQVRVAELSTTGVCKETKKIVQHKGSAHKLGLEPNSPVVFMSCGEDAAVFNIDLREQKPTKLMIVKEADKKVALYTIHVNPSKTNEFIVGGRDHFIRVFDKRMITDADDSGVVKKFCPHHLVDNEQVKANVTCCLYSYNGQEILASYNDEDIYLFDSSHSDGADSIRAYRGHRNNATVKGVNFYGPRSEFIVSGSDCGNIFLWEKESEKIVQYMQGDIGGVVNCLEPHPSLPCLATSGLDHDVKVWLPTRKAVTELEGLKKVMMTNRREREEERTRGPAFEDNAMMRFLMAHLRHRARRQAMEAGELDSSDSDDSSDSEDLPTASCATS